jgi:hypothetical protein
VIIATCEARTSVDAPIRLAMMRSGAAPIARSWLADHVMAALTAHASLT